MESATFEFVEHLTLYVFAIGIGLMIAHFVVNFSVRMLRRRYSINTRNAAKVVNDAALSLRMATSLTADANCVYEQLTGVPRANQ